MYIIQDEIQVKFYLIFPCASTGRWLLYGSHHPPWLVPSHNLQEIADESLPNAVAPLRRISHGDIDLPGPTGDPE